MGVGDPVGMPITHQIAGGMGGIRTAGDMVARMEMKRYRLKDAKRYVAKKLGVDVVDLSDEFIMRELREKLDIGTITGVPGLARGLEAKVRIAELLDIKINCVEVFKNRIPAKFAAEVSKIAKAISLPTITES